MNKVFSAIIIFSIGLLSGYSFIVFAGYIASWTYKSIVITAHFLDKYDLSFLLGAIDGLTNFIQLIFTGIPVFLISGFLLVYFFKHNMKTVKLGSSIGLFIIPFIFGGFPALYTSRFFDAFAVLAVPLFMNLLFINKMANVMNAPNKNEESNTNPQAD